MSDQNGITNSPFSAPFSTPDVGGTGVNGIGGGLDDPGGGDGITQSPFAEAVVPTPGMAATSDSLNSSGSSRPISLQGSGEAPQQDALTFGQSHNVAKK